MADLPNINLVSAQTVSSVASLRNTASVGDLRLEAQSRFDQVAVGKTFQAIITAMSQDGKALVQFPPLPPTNQSIQVQVELPAGYSVGDKINLQLLKPPPDLRFQLGNEAILVPMDEPDLSPAAKMLGQLLQSSDPNNPETSTLKGSQALLPATPSDTKQMASELPNHLHQAVQLSGAFYESHLKEWANGTRTLEQVRQEPQNQNPTTKLPGSEHLFDLPQTQLIPAQLNAQENRQFLWRGELLPGQPFEWQIKEDTSKKSSSPTSPEERSWQTTVKFDLPKLGQINATINLTGKTASFRIAAKNPDSAPILTNAQSLLTDSLEASGTTMSQFLVEKDGTST
jgi:hypothetical protein